MDEHLDDDCSAFRHAEIEHARHCAMVAREWAAECAVTHHDHEAESLLVSAREWAVRARELANESRRVA